MVEKDRGGWWHRPFIPRAGEPAPAPDSPGGNLSLSLSADPGAGRATLPAAPGDRRGGPAYRNAAPAGPAAHRATRGRAHHGAGLYDPGAAPASPPADPDDRGGCPVCRAGHPGDARGQRHWVWGWSDTGLHARWPQGLSSMSTGVASSPPAQELPPLQGVSHRERPHGQKVPLALQPERFSGGLAALHDLDLFSDEGNTFTQIDKGEFVGANNLQIAGLAKRGLQLLHAVEP